MSLQNVSAYKNTSVSWAKTQAQLMEYLEDKECRDVRFSTISWESAEKGGLVMEQDTHAIMIEFFRLTQLESGASGKIPVRVLIPNVPDDEKRRNQAYRLLFWYLKSKFEAVETGLVDFEQEFLPHLMIKDKSGFVGRVWDMLKKPYEHMIESGEGDFYQALPSGKEKENPTR